MTNLQNHGFIPNEIQPEDYILGGLTKLPEIILQPNGQWDNYLPETELQYRNGLETSNCTVYGTLNVLETLHKRLYGEEMNYSERYVGIVANTSPVGNSVQKIIETIRKKCGLIPEKLLPFSKDIDEWSEYYHPKPMTKELLSIGKEWLVEYKVLHEWIFGIDDKNKIARLKQGLKYSPLGVSVYGWLRNKEGLYYKPDQTRDNHWCMCYGYEEGKFWRIFDHYDNTHKKLVWNYDFGFAKRYYLERKVTVEEKEKVYSRIQLALNKIREAIKLIADGIEELKRSLGKMFK